MMPAPKLPRFRKGQQLADWKASELQALSDTVQTLYEQHKNVPQNTHTSITITTVEVVGYVTDGQNENAALSCKSLNAERVATGDPFTVYVWNYTDNADISGSYLTVGAWVPMVQCVDMGLDCFPMCLIPVVATAATAKGRVEVVNSATLSCKIPPNDTGPNKTVLVRGGKSSGWSENLNLSVTTPHFAVGNIIPVYQDGEQWVFDGTAFESCT